MQPKCQPLGLFDLLHRDDDRLTGERLIPRPRGDADAGEQRPVRATAKYQDEERVLDDDAGRFFEPDGERDYLLGARSDLLIDLHFWRAELRMRMLGTQQADWPIAVIRDRPPDRPVPICSF